MQPSQPLDPSASQPPAQSTAQPPTQSASQPPAQSTAQPPTQLDAQPASKQPVHLPHKDFKARLKRIGELIIQWNLVGLLLGLAIPALIGLVLGPPPDSTLVSLMNYEAQAAMHKDRNLVAQIYSPQAVVMDAGCTSGQGQTWTSLAQIQDRYSTLPSFATLEHTDVQITWVPNNFTATKAYAAADTLGALGSPPQPIHGHEQWVFAKINGQWRITLFTYNLCTP